MKEIPESYVYKLIELICFVQHRVRRARMESPLKTIHSERLGEVILAAEQAEEICRKTLNGRIKCGNGSDPATG